jgi:recombination protein RecA
MGSKEFLERLSKNKNLPNVLAGTDIRLVSHVPYGIPTGIPQLDLSLGRPGYPVGRIIELYGFEMSGKTTAALAACAEAQKLGVTVIWIDTEKAWDSDWARKCGVNSDEIGIGEAMTLEDIWRIHEEAIASIEDETLLIVTDSATAVISEASLKKDIGEEQRLGQDSRVMRHAMRKLNAHIAEKNVTCLFINHAIARMASFGKQSQAAGGHALKFYSSVRLEFQRTADIYDTTGDDKKRRGMKVNITVEKNKVMQTGKKTVAVELIEDGFNLEAGLFEALKDIGVIEKVNQKAWFFKPTETQLTKSEWPEFVEKQGGADKVYTYFLRAARDNGVIVPYGNQTRTS